MPMRKQLWTINGAATELGEDRRKLGACLSGVTPDGEVNGNPAWFLQTVLIALSGTSTNSLTSPDQTNPVLALVADRLTDRPSRRRFAEANVGDMPVADCAKLMGVPASTILSWLRVGLPYVQEGDWRNGEGFVLRLRWTIEWTALLVHAAHSSADRDILQRLQLAA